jgi:hypothetical protein
MTTGELELDHSSDRRRLNRTDIPIEQLVHEVYASATPSCRRRMLSNLVGKLFEIAPESERINLVAHLIKPLGLLSLAAIADGIFAKIRLRGGWIDVDVRLDDVRGIKSNDIVALTNYAQQVSTDVVHGLSHVFAASPVLASTATAALLVKILMRQ